MKQKNISLQKQKNRNHKTPSSNVRVYILSLFLFMLQFVISLFIVSVLMCMVPTCHPSHIILDKHLNYDDNLDNNRNDMVTSMLRYNYTKKKKMCIQKKERKESAGIQRNNHFIFQMFVYHFFDRIMLTTIPFYIASAHMHQPYDYFTSSNAFYSNRFRLLYCSIVNLGISNNFHIDTVKHCLKKY